MYGGREILMDEVIELAKDEEEGKKTWGQNKGD